MIRNHFVVRFTDNLPIRSPSDVSVDLSILGVPNRGGAPPLVGPRGKSRGARDVCVLTTHLPSSLGINCLEKNVMIKSKFISCFFLYK